MTQERSKRCHVPSVAWERFSPLYGCGCHSFCFLSAARTDEFPFSTGRKVSVHERTFIISSSRGCRSFMVANVTRSTNDILGVFVSVVLASCGRFHTSQWSAHSGRFRRGAGYYMHHGGHNSFAMEMTLVRFSCENSLWIWNVFRFRWNLFSFSDLMLYTVYDHR